MTTVNSPEAVEPHVAVRDILAFTGLSKYAPLQVSELAGDHVEWVSLPNRDDTRTTIVGFSIDKRHNHIAPHNKIVRRLTTGVWHSRRTISKDFANSIQEWAANVTGQFACFDFDETGYSVCTDFYSSVPIYIYRTSEGAWASTRLDWICLLVNTTWHFSTNQFFYFTSQLASTSNYNTLIDEIKILPALTVSRFACEWPDRKEQHVWHKLSFEHSSARGLLEDVTSSFAEAVRIRCDGPTKIAVSLTAGFDSRTNLAAAAYKEITVTPATWGSDYDHMDTAAARRLALLLNLPHLLIKQDDWFHNVADSSLDALIRTTGGLARHSFWFMKRFKDSLRDEFDIHAELNGLGAELLKGKYYKFCGADNTLEGVLSGFRNDAEKRLMQLLSHFRREAQVTSLANRYVAESAEECPHGLNPHEMCDWWAYQNRDGAMWRARTRFETLDYTTLIPWMDLQFATQALRLPHRYKKFDSLHKCIVAALQPALLQEPSPSSSFKHHLAKTLRYRLGLRNPVPSDWNRFAPQVVRRVSAMGISLSDALPWRRDGGGPMQLINTFRHDNALFRLFSSLRFAELLVQSGVKLQSSVS